MRERPGIIKPEAWKARMAPLLPDRSFPPSPVSFSASIEACSQPPIHTLSARLNNSGNQSTVYLRNSTTHAGFCVAVAAYVNKTLRNSLDLKGLLQARASKVPPFARVFSSSSIGNMVRFRGFGAPEMDLHPHSDNPHAKTYTYLSMLVHISPHTHIPRHTPTYLPFTHIKHN